MKNTKKLFFIHIGAWIGCALGIGLVGSIGWTSSLTSPEASRFITLEQMSEAVAQGYPLVEQRTPDELYALLESQEVILVDVRSAEETDVSMIPGAILWSDFLPQMEGLRDRMIVTYCTIGVRSSEKAKELTQKHFRTANLYGGILGWISKGYPIIHDATQTKRVHVYGAQWNLAPLEYETIY